MKTRAEIKDEVAREFGYKNYKEAKQRAFISNELEKAINKVIDLCCTEAIKEHLSRAAENAKCRTPHLTIVDRESITNIEIKLP